MFSQRPSNARNTRMRISWRVSGQGEDKTAACPAIVARGRVCSDRI